MMGMGVKRMSTKKSSSRYDAETNEFKTYVVNPDVFVETGTGPEQSVPYPPNGPEISLPYGAPDMVVTPTVSGTIDAISEGI